MGTEDSSNIASHLGRVHFFLVLICILVGFSLHGYSSSVPNAVYQQFESISRIKIDWMIWTKRFGTEQFKWLKDQGLGWPDNIKGDIYIPPEELTRENLPQRDNGWTASPLYNPIYLHLSVNLPSGSRHEILGRGYPQEDETEFIPGGYHAVGEPKLDTMEEFRQFWNASNNVVAFIVKDVSEVAYVVSNGEVKAALRWIPSPQNRQGTHLKLGRINIGQREGGDYCKDAKELLTSHWSPQFNVLFCGQAPTRPNEQPSQILVLPARYKDEPVPVNLRLWLADHFKFSAVGGKFEETFPDLYNFVKENPQMQFKDVNRILQLLRERSSEKVEFLGLRFRERDLASWGAGIIVIVQLYLWLHLRELRVRVRSKTTNDFIKVPWIGLYPDWRALIVSLLTASILPVAVLLYGRVTLDFSPFVFGALVLGVVFAIATGKLLWHLQGNIRHAESR